MYRSKARTHHMIVGHLMAHLYHAYHMFIYVYIYTRTTFINSAIVVTQKKRRQPQRAQKLQDRLQICRSARQHSHTKLQQKMRRMSLPAYKATRRFVDQLLPCIVQRHEHITLLQYPRVRLSVWPLDWNDDVLLHVLAIYDDHHLVWK